MVVREGWKNNGGIVLGLPVKQNKAKGYLKNGCRDFQVAFSSLEGTAGAFCFGGQGGSLLSTERLPEK